MILICLITVREKLQNLRYFNFPEFLNSSTFWRIESSREQSNYFDVILGSLVIFSKSAKNGFWWFSFSLFLSFPLSLSLLLLLHSTVPELLFRKWENFSFSEVLEKILNFWYEFVFFSGRESWGEKRRR